MLFDEYCIKSDTMGNLTPSAIPALSADDIAVCLAALCDTGFILCQLQGMDGAWYSLRLMPGEPAAYRVFSHNNGVVSAFSSEMVSRADACKLFLEILKS